MDQTFLNRLYRYAFSLTDERDEAYELLQQAIERYLRHQPNKVRSPLSYLMRSIRNAFFDRIRHNNLYQDIVEDQQQNNAEEVISPSIDDLLIQQQDIAQLLALLDNQERELLYLWAVEEYTIQEIADLQGVPRGTLLSRLHRLKNRLRKQLPQLEAEWRDGQ